MRSCENNLMLLNKVSRRCQIVFFSRQISNYQDLRSDYLFWFFPLFKKKFDNMSDLSTYQIWFFFVLTSSTFYNQSTTLTKKKNLSNRSNSPPDWTPTTQSNDNIFTKRKTRTDKESDSCWPFWRFWQVDEEDTSGQ